MACVAHTHADKLGLSWCGRTITMEFHFTSLDHAAYNEMDKGRLEPCSECMAVWLNLFGFTTVPTDPMIT